MIQFSAHGAYNIDRIAFNDKKSELYLWIKIKRIDNAWVKIGKRVGAKAQDEKMRWNTTKTKDGRNFPCTKFSVTDLLLAVRRNLSSIGGKMASSKSSIADFRSQSREMSLPVTEYVTFGFSFRMVFLPSRNVWMSLSVAIQFFQWEKQSKL